MTVDALNIECPFCVDIAQQRVVATLGTVYAIRDLYPVTDGHLLIIPVRHNTDFFTMTWEEKTDAFTLAEELKDKIRKDDPSVIAFNLGMNCGEAAGQTIMHAHIHLIPRRAGDTPSPRGGVRGVIPAKM